jgi:hypothetical protein
MRDTFILCFTGGILWMQMSGLFLQGGNIQMPPLITTWRKNANDGILLFFTSGISKLQAFKTAL